jgi:HAD superfamily hydrolase (TIGR01459 family)
MTTTASPPILATAAPLLARYEVVFCDVWGVVHDGFNACASACDALSRFRRSGGTVVLVSNAPVPNDAVAAMLRSRRVPPEAYDAIVSSGDIALAHVSAEGFETVHTVGPRDRDAALFQRLTARAVPLASAQAIVCSGLVDDVNETAETYRPLLEAARQRQMPFVCANPDLVVDVGGRLYLCAGAIATLYEEMGGAVFWAGKPHASAYRAATLQAETIRQSRIEPRRILAIGDALRTDIAGAESAGIDALFIGAGIHRAESMTGDALDPGKLARLFAPGSPRAIAAMPVLAW